MLNTDEKYKHNFIWFEMFLPFQQQLNTSFDDETAALLNDCYTLEEKERLKEEWRLFEEQKKNFERERKNFTEAAIRLGREVLYSSCRSITQLVSKRLDLLFTLFFFYFFNFFFFLYLFI